MSDADPVRLLFDGLEKLGPGDDRHTVHVLHMLPQARFNTVVDAGCGSGRQTLALAQELRTSVDAVDIDQDFLDELMRRARRAGLASLVRAHCMDMKDVPVRFPKIDLLWSEGAAYNIGFRNALRTWAPAVRFAVVSELCWLTDDAPAAVGEFFQAAYPAMQSVSGNVALAEEAGYRVIATHTLPRDAWVEGYYDALEPRARALLEHAAPQVREFAAETLREIEVFATAGETYGYVFYALQRA